MIVTDTSVLYALLDANDSLHEPARRWYEDTSEELITTPLVVAETDHLAGRAGTTAVAAFRHDLGTGALTVEWSDAILRTSLEVADRYRDLGIGLADASLVALAEVHRTTYLASFDERHFRTIRPLQGGSFALLPSDRVV